VGLRITAARAIGDNIMLTRCLSNLRAFVARASRGSASLGGLLSSGVSVSILILCSLAITLTWTTGGALPIGGDTPPVVNAGSLFSHYSSVWNWWGNLGFASPSIVTGLDPPLVTSLGILASLGLQFAVAYAIFLFVCLSLGAIAVDYISRKLNLVSRKHRRVPIAGLLYLATPMWFFMGQGDVASLAYSTAAVALVFASLLYVQARSFIVAVVFTSAPLLLLTTDFPFSIPRLAGIGAVVFVFDLFLLVTNATQNRRPFSFTARATAALALALVCTTYLWVSIPLAWSSYVVHSQLVSTLYPLVGYRAYADQVGFAFRGMNSWGMFNPTYNGLAWMTFYLSSPIGILSTFAIPTLAWASLLHKRRTQGEVNGIRTVLALGLLIVIAAGTGTTLPGTTALWGVITQLPEGNNLFAAAISTSFVPFMTLAYVLLAGDALSQLLRVANRSMWSPLVAPSVTRSSLHRAVAICRPYGRFLTVVTLALTVCIVAAGTVPSGLGEKAEWHTGSARAAGVSLPPTYAAANTWISANDQSGSNVLVLPAPGVWPTLTWSNTTGYQGYNPYQDLLPSAPVIDGSLYPTSGGGADAVSIYAQAADYAAEAPGIISSLNSPSNFQPSFLSQTPNLAGSTINWSNGRCTPCGNVSLNSSMSIGGSAGAVEFDANNSWGFENPNQNNLFLNVSKYVLRTNPVVLLWLNSSAQVLGQLRVGVEDGNGSVEWEAVQASAVKQPWDVFLFNLTHGWPKWSTLAASSIILNFPSTSSLGITRLIVGKCLFASALGTNDGSNLASLTYGWSVPYPAGESLHWSSTGLPGSYGSVELDTSTTTSSGNPNGDGLTYQLDSPVNLTNDSGLELWFQTQGFGLSQVSVGFEYSLGQITWYRVDPAVPFGQPILFGDWAEIEIPFSEIPATVLENVARIHVFFVPTTSTGAIELRIGFLGMIPAKLPKESVLQSLFRMLGVRYVLVDSALGSGALAIDHAITQVFAEKPSFSDGTVSVFSVPGIADTPLYVAPNMSSVTSPYDVLRDLANGSSTAAYCIQGTLCTDLNSSGLVTLISVSAPKFSSAEPINLEVRGPGLVVFPQLYSSEWAAEASGKLLSHVEVNGFSNGWLVGPGYSNLTITLTGQTAYQISLISGIALSSFFSLIALGLAVLPRSLERYGRWAETSLRGLVRKFVELRWRGPIRPPRSG
jgi:hypothetical protein